MYIDTHCHLSKDDYENIDDVIKSAKEENVKYLVVSGCDKKSIKESIEICQKYDNIFLALGYHPSEANITTDDDLYQLEQIIKNNDRVVAVGEIGLDYHWEKDNKEKQKGLFIKQIELAKKYNKPVVIHSRDAFQDTYDILSEAKHIGVIHCFSGNIENAKLYEKIGMYFGIGGVLTFKNSNLKETVKHIPIDKILLETDSPYISPEPFRGKRNEPKNIPIIAMTLANLLNMEKEEIGRITSDNANKLFKLKIDTKID